MTPKTTRIDNFVNNSNKAMNDLHRSLFGAILNGDSKIAVQLYEIPCASKNPETPDIIAEATVVTKTRFFGTSALPNDNPVKAVKAY